MPESGDDVRQIMRHVPSDGMVSGRNLYCGCCSERWPCFGYNQPANRLVRLALATEHIDGDADGH